MFRSEPGKSLYEAGRALGDIWVVAGGALFARFSSVRCLGVVVERGGFMWGKKLRVSYVYHVRLAYGGVLA